MNFSRLSGPGSSSRGGRLAIANVVGIVDSVELKLFVVTVLALVSFLVSKVFVFLAFVNKQI